jgi:hypothetical protein
MEYAIVDSNVDVKSTPGLTRRHAQVDAADRQDRAS